MSRTDCMTGCEKLFYKIIKKNSHEIFLFSKKERRKKNINEKPEVLEMAMSKWNEKYLTSFC